MSDTSSDQDLIKRKQLKINQSGDENSSYGDIN